MKLSDYAKSKGISYQTAWRMWKRGELKATQLPTGTVIVDVQKTFEGVVIYTRVSSKEKKNTSALLNAWSQNAIKRGL